MPLHLSSVSDGKDINNLFEYKILRRKIWEKSAMEADAFYRKPSESCLMQDRRLAPKRLPVSSRKITDRGQADLPAMAEQSHTGRRM